MLLVMIMLQREDCETFEGPILFMNPPNVPFVNIRYYVRHHNFGINSEIRNFTHTFNI